MKEVIRVETIDGSVFANEKEARKYLELQYSHIICSLAHTLNMKKFVDVSPLIDSSLKRFSKLSAIKAELCSFEELGEEL